jgi:hypothetical protein
MSVAELWALDHVEDGPAVDVITNALTIVAGWFDAYTWASMLALLFLLVVITFLLAADERERDCLRSQAPQNMRRGRASRPQYHCCRRARPGPAVGPTTGVPGIPTCRVLVWGQSPRVRPLRRPSVTYWRV